MKAESGFFCKGKIKQALCLFILVVFLSACTGPMTDDEVSLTDGSYQVIFTQIDLESVVVTLDEIEFVSKYDTDRISDLGLDLDKDFPRGFYLYNETEDRKDMQLAPDAHIEIILWEEQMEASWVTPEGLKERMDEYSAPYSIIVRSGEIIEIVEMYVF